jgi:endonuclease YncB( thermonuclease family)
LYNDFAEELVSNGLAQVLDVAVDAVEDQASVGMETLRRRLDRLHACQIKAQSMRYGIWKDWKEPKWKDRVLSASKRVTVNGLKQIVGKISSSSS